MRVLLKVVIPTERGNQRCLDGSLGTAMETILNDLKPEAAYFVEEQGERTGFIVCTLKEESEIPAIAEPFFLAFGARVEIHPAMTANDLKKGASGISRAVEKYGNMARAA
jgi:hypothetical protein